MSADADVCFKCKTLLREEPVENVSSHITRRTPWGSNEHRYGSVRHTAYTCPTCRKTRAVRTSGG